MYFTAFGKTPADYNVTVYQSTSDENIFRVENPLKGLYSVLGFSATSPNWEINVSDPDNISLPLVSTKINGGDTDGVYYAATKNQQYENQNDTPEDKRAKFVQDGTTLTFSFPAQSLILYASTAKKVYIGNSQPVTLTINNATSIDDITVDTDENAPVEYFNLQGMKVSNPTAGQLLIKRQGGTVTKVLVK